MSRPRPLSQRPWDILYALFILIHIPSTVIIDSQAILPAWLFPQFALDLMSFYLETFKDPGMTPPLPVWMSSFVTAELLFQLPFFLWGIRALWRDDTRFLPFSVAYGAHTATTVWVVFWSLAHHYLYPTPGSLSHSQIVSLLLLHAPFFLIPVSMVIRGLILLTRSSDKVKSE
ncbi:MAG: transmembrane protein 6/97 [Piptocephalis tieghemiana]|nr:MAG: transmembrane protein 6/97 [Piptocephalis tieghemiana]